MFSKKSLREILSLNTIFALSILPLLVVFTLMNTEYLYNFDISISYVWIYLLYSIFSTFGLFLMRKKRFSDKTLESELIYTLRSIFLFVIFFLPAVWGIHFFLANHIGETNLYLRAYGKIAFIFLALALSVSPILEFVKDTRKREWILLSRKIFGILSFIFFLKHGLEYYAAEYVFQVQYHSETPYLNYVLENTLVRYDALSGVVVGMLMLLLGCTSNKISIKLFGGKKWKMIQSLVYPAFLLSLIHIAFAGRFELLYGVMGVGVVGLRTLVYLKKNEVQHTRETTQYLCQPCGYIYDEAKGDPDGGIPPGTKFVDIPDDWVCPVCGVGKSDFIGYYNSENTIFGGDLGTILRYNFLTKDVLELSLEMQRDFEISLGQYIILAMQDFDGEFSRSYSVVKYHNRTITLLIKCKDTGRAGRALKKYTVGDTLKVTGVYGNFILQNTMNPKVFIASGTGLAPIYNMLQGSNISEPSKLLFTVQMKEDLFYLSELTEIQNLEIHVFLSRDELLLESTEIQFYAGRMNLGKFEFVKNTEFYICGAPGLVDDTKAYLGEKGFTNIYFEKFTI